MAHFFPNLFIPGAAKSGTTTLHELLDIHPDICMSTIKEPMYWNNPEFKNFNLKNNEKYAKLFANKNAKIFGESTTSYLYFPRFIENIKSNYKVEPKFIFILRNPIDRSYSHYQWMVGLGLEKSNFRNAIEKDLKSSFKPYDYYPNHYFHFGLYAKWLVPFYENFERGNIKIITFDDLTNNRSKTINECFEFLGLETLNDIPEIVSNKTFKLNNPRMFHFIEKTYSGKYKYTKAAKYLIPRKQIENIREKLRYMSLFKKRKDFEYPKIETNERKWLKSLYVNDIMKLKEITKYPFEEWTDFL
jgi:hypothetical protein